MDSILSCMTAGHNIYTINRERKQLFLTQTEVLLIREMVILICPFRATALP